MRFVIVTGMSGAGKSSALKFLEDIGFSCSDNIPPSLIEQFAAIHTNESEERKTALGIDIRGGALLSDLLPQLDRLVQSGATVPEILFLDASDKTLIHRYKETRRVHPLSPIGDTATGLRAERTALAEIKDRADIIIDTSSLLTRQLKEQINAAFKDGGYDNLVVTVMSFGFKKGIPEEADLVFDVRFLPNPFYEDELKEGTGLDADVREFVMRGGDGEAFLSKIEDLLTFLIPRYIAEGKNSLVIAVGCTGGKHRSVTIADKLFDFVKLQGRNAVVTHRDIPSVK